MAYKGDFLSGSVKDFKYGHPTVRKKIRKIGQLLQESAAARVGIGEYLHGIGADQRQWADRNIRPIERGLSADIQSRLGDDGQRELMADAQQGTLDAYDRSALGAVRNAARYGVTLDDPSLDRGYQLDRTAAAIEAGDMAARTDRDNALAEAGQFYGYGAGLPADAAQTYAAGAGSIADQEDYAAGIKIGKYVGQGDAAKAAGMAWTKMADGGVVALGGRPGKTIDLRKQYNEYRVEASSGPNPPKEWPTAVSSPWVAVPERPSTCASNTTNIASRPPAARIRRRNGRIG
ncbi:MAG: hypothetical protein M1457_03845 [bacterium]|nr:hypothetical protein [bacterium]